jgi:serine/threonine-protein kinase
MEGSIDGPPPSRRSAAWKRSADVRAGTWLTPSVQLVRKLGGGGMGTLWVGHHAGLKSDVAVKLLADALVGRDEAIVRFEREAAAASKVRSPHVVQLLDYGVSDALGPYIVMELLRGSDLAATLRARGRLPPAEVVAILEQLAKALDRTHAQGLIHRDVKPGNVFLCEEEPPFVKLLDFGVARSLEPTAADVTRSGSLVGTPAYMSPEQLLGNAEVDAGADLWALGVLAFQCLTGERPFQGATPAAMALGIHAGPPPRLTSLVPSLPAAVDAWFSKACAAKREGRFATAGEAVVALARALSGGGAKLDAAAPLAALASEATMSLATEATHSVSLGVSMLTPPVVARGRRGTAATRLAIGGAIAIAAVGVVLRATSLRHTDLAQAPDSAPSAAAPAVLSAPALAPNASAVVVAAEPSAPPAAPPVRPLPSVPGPRRRAPVPATSAPAVSAAPSAQPPASATPHGYAPPSERR